MQWLASRLDGRADNTRVTVATATAEPRPPACCPCRSTDLLRPCQQQRRRRASTAAESRASQWREAAWGTGASPPWGRRIVCGESLAAAASRCGRRGRCQPLRQLLDDNAAVRESSVVQFSSEAKAMLGSPIALNARPSGSVQRVKADIVQKSGEIWRSLVSGCLIPNFAVSRQSLSTRGSQDASEGRRLLRSNRDRGPSRRFGAPGADSTIPAGRRPRQRPVDQAKLRTTKNVSILTMNRRMIMGTNE